MTTASNKRKASTAMTAPEMVGIVITVDHVYLPLGPDGNVVAGWTASNVFTSKVLRRTHLKAPADLARFLADRDQAEITSGDRSSFAKASEDASSFAKASEDASSEAPRGA